MRDIVQTSLAVLETWACLYFHYGTRRNVEFEKYSISTAGLWWENKALLIAYFLSNISAKNYQNQFRCVKITARQSIVIFLDTVYVSPDVNKLTYTPYILYFLVNRHDRQFDC